MVDQSDYWVQGESTMKMHEAVLRGSIAETADLAKFRIEECVGIVKEETKDLGWQSGLLTSTSAEK